MGNQPTTEYGQIYSKGSQYDNILCEESMKLFIKRIKHSDIDSFTEFFVIQTVQREAYSKVFKFIEGWKSLPNDHPLVALSPFVDQQGVLCVRSRLDKKNLGGGDGSHHPVIMPKNQYVTKVLVRRFHNQVLHQGCLLTEGAIRTCGFWVVGATNLVRSEIVLRFMLQVTG